VWLQLVCGQCVVCVRLKKGNNVGPTRTRLECPICGLDVLEEDGDDDESSLCEVHRCMLLFSRGDPKYALAARDALERIDWWTPYEKSEFLEVLCGVAGMHELEVVQTSDLRLDQGQFKVLFDTTSLEAFGEWFRDKLARSRKWPYFRFECALQIRELWRANMHGREIEKQLEQVGRRGRALFSEK
jgi:hypothetical protein